MNDRKVVVLAVVLLGLLPVVGCPNNAADGPDATPTPDPELSPLRDCVVYLRTGPRPNDDLVEVAGSFNNWQPESMTQVFGSDEYERRLGALFPGVYPYKFLYNGNWEGDPPVDQYTAFDGNNENRALYVGDCQLPSIKAISGSADADGNLLAEFQYTRAGDGRFMDRTTLEATVGGEPVVATVNVNTGVITVEASDLAPGKHSVRVTALDNAGRAPEGGASFLPLWVEPRPFAWSDGPMYFAFVDRFRDSGPAPVADIGGAAFGAGYMGGDLIGLKEAIDEGWMEQLGVRSIWLSPLYQNPDGVYTGISDPNLYAGYHGYWPTDGRDLEDRFGTEAVSPEDALRQVVEAAHARGIRVLLDTVLNHVHDEHSILAERPEWFTAQPCTCIDDGPADPWDCNWDNNPVYCWFTDYLPDVDYRQPGLVERYLADLRYLVEEYDIDGFRVDAAKHMDHVIMRSMRLRLDELYAAPGGAFVYTVGETFTGRGGQALIMDYVADYELHGQFDFPLYWAIREAVGQQVGFDALVGELAASEGAYGANIDFMSPFMGNHDIARYATEIGGCDNPQFFGGCTDILASGDAGSISGDQWNIINKMATSYALVTTLRGVPLLYYGDEIGLAGSGDPDNRRLMQWDNLSLAQRTLLDRVRLLGRTRSTTTALQRGGRETLYQDNELFIFARDAGNGESAIVAMNIGGGSRNQQIFVPTALDLEGATVRDKLVGLRSANVSGGQLTVSLDPWEYVILARD